MKSPYSEILAKLVEWHLNTYYLFLGVAEKLKKRKGTNGSHLGFLRQRPDGTTSLNILTGESGVIPGTEKDRPVLLGSLLGKVKQGTGSIQVII